MTTTTASILNVTDIVRALTGTPYKMTAETAININASQRDIRDLLDEAIADGYVTVIQVRDTTYGANIRFVTLADGIAYCPTCDNGCHCESGGPTSCGHHCCWGPNPTNDCVGVGFGRLKLAHSIAARSGGDVSTILARLGGW